MHVKSPKDTQRKRSKERAEGVRLQSVISILRNGLRPSARILAIFIFVSGFASSEYLYAQVSAQNYWSAEKRLGAAQPTSTGIFPRTVILNGWVAAFDREQIVSEARQLFPLHDIQDKMRETTTGVNADAAIYAMRLLAGLAKGTVEIKNGVLAIQGTAKTSRKDSSEAIIAAGVPPADLTIGKVLIEPPNIKNFTWSATKTAEGIKLDGFLPSEVARTRIVEDVANRFPDLTVTDNTIVASGAPKNFVAAAKVGISQLQTVDAGVAHISGSDYSVFAYLPPDTTGTTAAILHTNAKRSLPQGYKSTTVKATSEKPAQDPRSVDFLFATDRVRKDEPLKANFNYERAASLTFGLARVHVPDDHKIGNIELPGQGWVLFGITFGKEDVDPKKHFIIKSVEPLARSAWTKMAEGNEAIVFVHGYNTTFDQAVLRTAQLIWDLQYRGTAVLFSWPSRGDTLSYEYDRNSALVARTHFIELLKILEQEAGIKQVHVIAHSMGNLVVLDALANHIRTGDPLKIAQLIMAAPDVDRDQYLQVTKSVSGIVNGMTLYASAADKAMLASRTFAQGPRAGDVLGGVPTIVEGVDAIDVTAVGDELFGLDHDTFAAKRSLINDIGLVLQGKRPPNSRLAEIRSMPEGAPKPLFWRYAP